MTLDVFFKKQVNAVRYVILYLSVIGCIQLACMNRIV